MRYPTPGEYQEALQFPAAAFRDPALQAAVPEENALGLPRAVTGAFAAVFPVARPAGPLAVKCFLTDVPDQRARYEAVARHLARVDLPYLAGFDYQPEGIVVDGKALPVLVMAWIEGMPLDRFVAGHLDRPDVLADLAERWAAMLRDLAAARVAHGDLQHGNVLVEPDGDGFALRLVDYDTTYVPALKGRRSPEIGHRNYQHPDRGEDDFGPHLDHFAGLVVYTALRACVARPSLWTRYDTGENLLFRASDFYDPAQSPLFAELEEIELLRPLVEALRRACYLEPDAVPPLAAVLGDAAVRPTLRRRLRVRRRPAGDGTWRDAFERAFLPVVVLALAVGGVLLATGFAGGAAAGVAVLGLLWAGVYRYRRLPAVRRRRRLRREVAYFERRIARLEAQAADLDRERHDFMASREALHARRLREVQEAALEDRLKHHFIGEAGRFDGVTHKVVVRLKASGLRTAMDATPERLAAIVSLSDDSKARVAAWRASLVRRYADEVPAALSPAELRRLERFTHQRLDALAAEAARLREKVSVQRTEQAAVARRRDEIPDVSFGRYLAFLLRLSTLPSVPAPTSRPVPSPAHSPAPQQPLAPPPGGEERPWWADDRS